MSIVKIADLGRDRGEEVLDLVARDADIPVGIDCLDEELDRIGGGGRNPPTHTVPPAVLRNRSSERHCGLLPSR